MSTEEKRVVELPTELYIKTLFEQHVAAQEEAKRYNNGNGGGGNMEARIAKLESDVAHIQGDIMEIKSDIREIKKTATTDFRLLFGAIITTALGLAYMMAHGFKWM